MFTSIIKQIWNRRRSNAWLFVELLVVFCLLWYVVDYQFTAMYVTHEPKGYDTQHVYHVSIAINPNLRQAYQGEHWEECYLQVFKQVSAYPGVESACYYGGTIPYEEGSIYQGYTVDSIHRYIANIRMVSKGFFDVFKVDLLQGSPSRWDVGDYPRPAIVSKDLADSLFARHPAIGASFFDYYAPDKKYTIGGIAARTKLTEYDRYAPFIYVPAEDWMLTEWAPMLAVRVNEDMDKGFVDRFTADMRNLSIGPFYFSQIKSYDEAKAIFDSNTNNYLRSSLALVLFFIFNVALGVLGTFWFRTKKRKGEIGLRLALGASHRDVFREFLLEGVIMLLMAVVPALVICLNIWHADLTVNVWMNPTLFRLAATMGITLSIMLFIVVVAICYPARQATKIQPAVALHEE